MRTLDLLMVLNYHRLALVDFLRLVVTKDFLQCDYIFRIIAHNKIIFVDVPAIWKSRNVVRWFLNTSGGFLFVGPGICESWTTWWTDFKTLRCFFSRNLLEHSFAIAFFHSALFSLTCLFCISSVGSSCIEEFSCWDSVHFFLRYFFTRALVNSLFIFNLSLIWFFHPFSGTEDN